MHNGRPEACFATICHLRRLLRGFAENRSPKHGAQTKNPPGPEGPNGKAAAAASRTQEFRRSGARPGLRMRHSSTNFVCTLYSSRMVLKSSGSSSSFSSSPLAVAKATRTIFELS